MDGNNTNTKTKTKIEGGNDNKNISTSANKLDQCKDGDKFGPFDGSCIKFEVGVECTILKMCDMCLMHSDICAFCEDTKTCYRKSERNVCIGELKSIQSQCGVKEDNLISQMRIF